MCHSGTNEIEPLEQRKSEHRALALLRFLDREPGNVSNESIITHLFDEIGLYVPDESARRPTIAP